MKLYRKRDNWSVKFTEKIAAKLGLAPSQVYKWSWDRHEQEKHQLEKLEKMHTLPDKIWHVEKVRIKKTKKISKVGINK